MACRKAATTENPVRVHPLSAEAESAGAYEKGPSGRREDAGGNPVVEERHGGKFLGTGQKNFARQVLLYCIRLRKCGTFIPLSGVRGESRIAGVWTLFVLVFSSVSSVHFSILFRRAVAFTAIDCG